MGKQKPPKHPFLAQMLFRPLHEWVPCQGAVHKGQKAVPSGWEVRMYQDTDLLMTMFLQGKTRAEIGEVLWQRACREQDTVGIVVHKQMYLCDECTNEVLTRHGGNMAAFLSYTASVATRQPILLLSDRLTEQAGLLGGLPRDIKEKDILERLETTDMVHIRF